MNFFAKLKSGLSKSSSKLNQGLTDIFAKKRVDNQTLEELEELLFTSDLGPTATFKIIENFRNQKLDKDFSITEIKAELAKNIATILKPCEAAPDFNYTPAIILMVGVNGAGKTTTIGKLAAQQKAKGKQVSMIAGDTFRAAAVEQLKEWGKKSNIRVLEGNPNADPAGLIYDGLQEALKQNDDVVFIDTAGRLQNKTQLMDELKKINRVIKKIEPDAPHETILCLDAATGQNAADQVKTFKEAVDVSGLIITKLDGTNKGGVVVSIADSTKIPIYYIGLGEHLDDLDTFNADDFAKNLVGIDQKTLAL